MATTTTNVEQLKINYLTEAQYEEAKTAGTLNENEIYMTASDNGAATKLKTARNINGVPFDGTADITIEDNTKLLSTDVVNASNVSVEGKALDARQANPNIADTMAANIATNTTNISTLNENLASKTTLQLSEIVGSVKTYALSLNDSTMNLIYTTESTKDLPINSTRWKYTTGIILKRYSTINIILTNYEDCSLAIIGYSNETWTDWVIK